jgi:hypothetical protein
MWRMRLIALRMALFAVLSLEGQVAQGPGNRTFTHDRDV